MSIIKKIKNINDINNLNEEELKILSDELRQEIISTVLSNGGHLASNLGVVELTIALLRTFDFDRDILIFDVGHQSYAYKLLTGRLEDFSTLRQLDGLSGFPKREESNYDYFNTGHASTSLSAAEGYYKATSLLGKDNYVVAVIGDGALTGGMCWEAMNNLVNGNDNVIIILNDNAMSIDKNVGALDQLLSDLRIRPAYLSLKESTEIVLNKLPLIGPFFKHILLSIKKRLRKKIQPDSIFFEEFGIKYYGPIDGHNIKLIEENLEAAKSHSGPIILHVCTKKGYGYSPAELEPSDYHGVAPQKKTEFDLNPCQTEVSGGIKTYNVNDDKETKLLNDEDDKYSTINFFKKKDKVLRSQSLPNCDLEKNILTKSKRLTEKEFISKLREETKFTDAFSLCLMYLSQSTNNLTAITAAMKKGTGLADFASTYPERFFDVGIAEQHAVTMAAGMAAGGLCPIVCIYSTFMQRALDQLLHDVCLQNLKVIFVVDRSGIVGEDGETHQGIYDLIFTNSLPSIKIYTPSDSLGLYRVLKFAIEQELGPVMIRYPRGKVKFDLHKEFNDLSKERKISVVANKDFNECENMENISDLRLLFAGGETGMKTTFSSEKDSLLIVTNSTLTYSLLDIFVNLDNDELNRITVLATECLKPFPCEEMKKYLSKYNNILVLEEVAAPGIIYPNILALVNENDFNCKIKAINLGTSGVSHGKQNQILEKYSLAGQTLKGVIRDFLA